MKPEKICGTCCWHIKDINGDWYCANDDSYYCEDWTDYKDSCGEWEERE
jgi:hypothetical protein